MVLLPGHLCELEENWRHTAIQVKECELIERMKKLVLKKALASFFLFLLFVILMCYLIVYLVVY